MANKYIGNNSTKSFINKLFNTIPSSEINNDELNKLWNTCDMEIGEQSELANWVYRTSLTNTGDRFITLQSLQPGTTTSKITIYGAYKIGDEVYRTKLTTCSGKFKQNSNLTSVEFKPGIDCSELNTMNNMFDTCYKLTEIKGLNNLDTSNVTNMRYMFYGCNSLSSLDLSNFNTSNVTTMNSMFYNCNSLTSLDLTSFNISKTIDMPYMFGQCPRINSIKVSRSKWIINSNCYTHAMFVSCGVSEVTYAD